MEVPRPVIPYASARPKPERSPQVAGRALRCGHCDRTVFIAARGRPAEALCGLLGVAAETVGDSADVFTCVHCGRVEIFLSIRSDVRSAAQQFPAIECRRCNMIVHSDEACCSHCGWTRPASTT